MSQALVETFLTRDVHGTLTRTTRATPRTSTAPSGRAAGYAMAEIYAGPKLFLLPGVRYEYTSDDFIGRDVRFAPNGAWLGSDPLAVEDELRRRRCRRFHLRYAVTPNTNLRFAVTRTLARPNYYDARPVPRAGRQRARPSRSATPTCSPTTSWNVDVLAEHYFKSVGVVSAGVFYKNLDDYIYTYTLQQQINGVAVPGDAAAQRRRGDACAASRSRCRTSCGSCRRRSTASASTRTTRSPIRRRSFPSHSGDSTLPGQSRHVGNLAVSYEKARLQRPRRR